jgi:hypothetical protein
MDARLQLIHGQRPYLLRREDLSVLARAIVGISIGRVRAHTDFRASIPVVLLEGYGLRLLVRKEDWDKILPLLKEPLLYPDPKTTGYRRYAYSHTRRDAPEETRDAPLYTRILNALSQIFTESFPKNE